MYVCVSIYTCTLSYRIKNQLVFCACPSMDHVRRQIGRSGRNHFPLFWEELRYTYKLNVIYYTCMYCLHACICVYIYTCMHIRSDCSSVHICSCVVDVTGCVFSQIHSYCSYHVPFGITFICSVYYTRIHVYTYMYMFT